MPKLVFALFAVAFAGSASAAGWRSLRIDASSDTAFEQSLAAFKDKLSPARVQVFGQALTDIWFKGTRDAVAQQREYTASDYYRQVDGLGYEQVVKFTDPSGDTAKARMRRASRSLHTARALPPYSPPREDLGETPSSRYRSYGSGENWRGRTPLTGPGGQQ